MRTSPSFLPAPVPEPAFVPRGLVETHPQGQRVARALTFGALLPAIPAAFALGLAAATRSRRTGIAGGVAALVGMLAFRWQLQRWFTDEPSYVVEARRGDLEIRRYQPRVEARTMLYADDIRDALDKGFDRLGGYIFGGNGDHEKLAMTVPVTAWADHTGTADLTTAEAQAGLFVVSFVMPPQHAVPFLPPPDDSRIELLEAPERRVAVLRFRGIYDPTLIARHARELIRQSALAQLDPVGTPIFAGFDPPTTVGFLRRAEVWLELA